MGSEPMLQCEIMATTTLHFAAAAVLVVVLVLGTTNGAQGYVKGSSSRISSSDAVPLSDWMGALAPVIDHLSVLDLSLPGTCESVVSPRNTLHEVITSHIVCVPNNQTQALMIA